LQKDGCVIQQKPSLEVIGAVENQWKPGEQFPSIPGSDIGDDPLHAHVGVDGSEAPFGGDGLRQGFARIRFLKERLALQVRQFHEIPVDNPQPSDTRSNKEIGNHGPKRAAAHQDSTRPQKLLLASLAEARKKNLSGISFVLPEVHAAVSNFNQ
jgi:hypothetical protein